jgi:hypothetical protein
VRAGRVLGHFRRRLAAQTWPPAWRAGSAADAAGGRCPPYMLNVGHPSRRAGLGADATRMPTLVTGGTPVPPGLSRMGRRVEFRVGLRSRPSFFQADWAAR